jgi:hypothetical protein
MSDIIPRLNFFDGQALDLDDFQDEQSHQESSRKNLELDFHGEGVLLDKRVQPVIFNSLKYALPLTDGQPITLEKDLTDQVDGNLLEINVTKGHLDGVGKAKLILIGRDRDNKDFFETIELGANGFRLTRNFYRKLRAIIPSGFITSQARLVIRESSSLEVDKDFIMAEQSLSPNQFLREFPSFNPLFITIEDVIASTVSDVSVLNIDTSGLEQITLNPDDITTIIGQKFLATTDNIQKVQLLLSIDPDTTVAPPPDPDDPNPQFDWTGDIVVSIRPLATSTACPGDVVPPNPIDFDPELVPIAQASLDRQDLEDVGIRLTDTPEAIDFVFSTTSIGRAGENSILIPGQYYAVTIQRQGAANKGKIKIDVGQKRTDENSLFTSFDGKEWLDNASKDLWFKVFTAASLVADGVAYDNGIRVSVKKTTLTSTGITISFLQENNSVSTTSEGVPNLVTVEQRELLIDPEPHPRTGNPTPTRVQDIANISTFTQSQFDSLTDKSVLLACIQDNNIKSGTNLRAAYSAADFTVGNTIFFSQFPPPFSGLNLKNHIFIFDAECPNKRFRIISNTDSTISVEKMVNPDPDDLVDLPALGSEFTNPGLFNLQYEIRFSPVWNEEDLIVIDKRTFLTRSFLETVDGYACLALHVPCDIYLGGKILLDAYGGVDGYGIADGYNDGYGADGYRHVLDSVLVRVETIPGITTEPENLQTTLEAISSRLNIITGGPGGIVDSAAIIPADGTTGQNVTIGTGVKTGHIQDNAITQPKMATASVGTDELIDLNVTNAKLATNSVSTTKIVDLNVTNPKLADNAVSTSKIQDGAVTPSKLSFVVGGGLPTGMMFFMFGSTCPAGTVREALLDGLFLRGAVTGSATPLGSDTHSHPPHTHTGSTGAAGSHSHSISGGVLAFHGVPPVSFSNLGFGSAAEIGHGHDGSSLFGSTSTTGSHSHSLSISSDSEPAASNVPAHAEVLICRVL